MQITTIKISEWNFDDLLSTSFWDSILTYNLKDEEATEMSTYSYELLWETLSDNDKQGLFKGDVNMFYDWLDILDDETYNSITEDIINQDAYITDKIIHNEEYLNVISEDLQYNQYSIYDIIVFAEKYEVTAIINDSMTIILTGYNTEKLNDLVTLFMTNKKYIVTQLNFYSKMYEKDLKIYVLAFDNGLDFLGLS